MVVVVVKSKVWSFTLYCMFKVAEFELSASTLRTNSSALTLCKNLVTQSTPDVFDALRDFRPRPRPDLPEEVQKRMEEWVQMKEHKWKHGRTWAATKRGYSISREELRERALEREQERVQELAESRAEAWAEAQKTEKEMISSSMRDEKWKLPVQWWLVDGKLDVFRSREDKKQVHMKAREQLRKLGAIAAQREESTPRTGEDELGLVGIDLWDGGWLKRAEDEHMWMKKDQAENPEQWGEKEWLWVRFWWNDVREWAGRWRWRIDVIEEFEKTCANLLLQLEKIDGSASARDFNVFSASDVMYEVECCHLLTDYVADMKIALMTGDEHQFVCHSKSALDLIGGVLRSKGVKQGTP